MGIIERHNVNVTGNGAKTIVFAHGFGCDQTMWQFVAPAFVRDYRVVLFDLMGAGQSDLSDYDFDAYSDLLRHGQDIVDICDALDLEAPVVIGHSVSAITSGLAAAANPGRFSRLAMVSPSPCFMNDGAYHGGFDREDLHGVVEFMQENYLGWAQQLAPAIAGQSPDEPAAQMLTQSFCRTDPNIARHFGQVTFLSDRRADMHKIDTPTLIVQSREDGIAPVTVGEWMQAEMPHATLKVIDAIGHCPHMTSPQETAAVIRDYLDG